MKKLFFLLSILFFSFFFCIHIEPARSEDQVDVLQQQIDNLKRSLDMSINATTPLEQRVSDIKVQLADIQGRVSAIETDVSQKQKVIQDDYAQLTKQQEILASTVRAYYIRSVSFSPFLVFLSSQNSSTLIHLLAYQKRATEEDKALITNTALTISDLEDRKKALEQEQASLATAKKNLASEKQQFDTIIAGAKAYQAQLQGQIADLSAQQQALIAARSGNFSVSVGSAAIADDFNASLTGWQQNAPGQSVTIFSFGAYANNGGNYRRNGMSQYGAWARAKAGQDYNTILQAYYGTPAQHETMPGKINTDQGTMDFETQYLYGIAEMPSSWTDNDSAALKAQAVAARTFAYHYIQQGRTICTDDHCQVYSASKVTDPSAAAWRAAVDATQGMVLPDNVSAQYVSTPGGYLDTKGWDTTCGNQNCLSDSAYDAASPWFYKAWYTNFFYGQGFSSCDRSNPWLSQNDISDILNAWLVYTNGTDDDRKHILPPDGCGAGGGNPYSIDQMKSRADALGGSYSNVSSVSVQQSTGGYTAQVTFQTNRGGVSMAGFDTGCDHSGSGCHDFWSIFNLRAPGNISIKSRMFDIRVK